MSTDHINNLVSKMRDKTMTSEEREELSKWLFSEHKKQIDKGNDANPLLLLGFTLMRWEINHYPDQLDFRSSGND